MQPLVSCLMITQAGRYEMFQLAVRDFVAQNYGPCELVIVSSSPPASVAKYKALADRLSTPARPIRWCPMPCQSTGQRALGVMRNYSNDVANGEFCCTWDDDDRYHPDRLLTHYDAIERNQVDLSYLNDQLHCFLPQKFLYWVDWGHQRCPGILMYRRTLAVRYPTAGNRAHRGEDTSFVSALVEHGLRQTVITPGTMVYLRYFHGRNTWSFGHHITLARRCSLSPEQLISRRHQIAATLRTLNVGPLNVYARQGFVYSCP